MNGTVRARRHGVVPVDYALFCGAVIAGAVVCQLWLSRMRPGARIPAQAWPFIAAILVAGYFAADAAGERERERTTHMVSAMAPTYAAELERMGHAAIGLDTEPDDPRYLAMIDAQMRWLTVNPTIADVYTMRLLPDGRTVFIVDSETDYDHNGAFEGDRESRTEIGEQYDEVESSRDQAFAGTAAFHAEPTTDRWGMWVGGYVPMRDQTGAVEAVLGVDYDASLWLQNIALARVVALGGLTLLAFILLSSGTVVGLQRADLVASARMEAQVRGFNTELERRVAASTAELTASNAELTTQIAERERAQGEMERLHQELLEISRQAGMAEVASGVLHNVGNVLNSVNVSSRLVADTVRQSKLANFAKLAEVLRQHDADLGTFLTTDPRGRQIPPYLLTLADHLAGEQRFMVDELESLRKHINHIKEVVRMQQGFARVSGVGELLPAAELVEDALQISGTSLTRHNIDVVRDFATVPPVYAERHKVIQILVNLISNAKQALADAPPERRMTLRIAGNGDGRVRIGVADNGAGITEDTMARLFSHGFTTKPGGHGFGLHNSALVAKELGASLTAESGGAGRGATFTLELPTAAAA